MRKILLYISGVLALSGFAQSSIQEQKAFFKDYHYANEESWDQLRADGKHLMPPAPAKLKAAQDQTTCALNKRVFGWFPYWQGSTYNNFQWNLLSDFCYFDYTVNASDGSNSNSSFVWSSSAAVTAAKNNGSNIHFCASLFSSHATFLGSSTAMQTFINNTISLLNARGGKGVNIDFEGMGASNKAAFTSFIQNLSAQLKAANPNYEVSIALYSVDWNAVFDIPNLKNYVDLFIIMGYDYYYSGSSTAGPESPLYNFQTSYNYTCASSIDYYLKAGVPNTKLLLGLPYYGRDWSTNSGAIPSSTTGSSSNTRLFNTVKANASGNYSAANYNWDANSFNPAYIYQSGGVWYQCWIDDKRSMAYKFDMVNQRSLGGIGIWALGYDDGYSDFWDDIKDKFSSCATVACTDTIYDMGGPNRNYYNNETYTFTIAPTGANKVKLSFTQFNIEQGFDSLWIYDGSSVTAPLVGKYTGTVTPATFTSTGSAITIRFKSDGATVDPGYMAVWQCITAPPDVTAPTTVYNSPTGWITQSFTANFTDADNSGGSGLEKKFYQAAFNNGTEWRANQSRGFFQDDFNAAINAEWTQKTGTWTITSQHLEQTDQTNSNTNIYAPLTQTLSNRYLYSWQGMISGTGTNRRAGLHFFCNQPDSTNRGNNYFVWYRVDQSAIEIYKTTNNVFSLVKSFTHTISPGVWYDNMVSYDRVTGEIDIWMNNTFVGSYTDASPLSNGGYVSFRSGNCDYAVDNFKVYRSRTSTPAIAVGSANTNDLMYQNTGVANYAGIIRSVVKDSAYNLSTVVTQTLNVDWSKPVSPAAINDGTVTDIDTVYTTSQLSANWSAATDPNSGITTYSYAIGTTPGGQNTIGWTTNGTNTSVTKTGLSLAIGQHYYFTVKAVDGAGLVCDSVNSDGVIVLATTGINSLAVPAVKIYPNPNNGSFTVEMKELQSATVEVYNAIGELVRKEEAAGESILFSGMEKGFYTVVISAGRLRVATQRVIVAR